MGILTGISLFSGAGGLDLAAKWAGIQTVCYVENDLYAQAVLQSRMRDGGLEDAPIWDDVTTFDGRPWRGKVDIVFGGFPCQPHSSAGKRGGASDERNLWPDFLRIVRECGARFVIAENVLGIFDTGYAIEVLAGLEESGYCATPFSSSACAFGAPHSRKRVFFLAHAKSAGWKQEPRRSGTRAEILESPRRHHESFWTKEISSEDCRIPDGLAFGLDRHRLAGNGVVPQSALPAFEKIVRMARQ